MRVLFILLFIFVNMNKLFYEYILKAGFLISLLLIFITYLVCITGGAKAYRTWEAIPFSIFIILLVIYFSHKFTANGFKFFIQKHTFILIFGLFSSSMLIYTTYEILFFQFTNDVFITEYINILEEELNIVNSVFDTSQEMSDKQLTAYRESILPVNIIRYFVVFKLTLCFVLSFVLSFFLKKNNVNSSNIDLEIKNNNNE